MILLETTDNGKDREYHALGAMAGIGCRGITVNEKDIKEILKLNNEGIRDQLEYLSTKFLPLYEGD